MITCILTCVQKRIAIVIDFLATHFWQSLFPEKPTYKIPIGSNDDYPVYESISSGSLLIV